MCWLHLNLVFLTKILTQQYLTTLIRCWPTKVRTHNLCCLTLNKQHEHTIWIFNTTKVCEATIKSKVFLWARFTCSAVNMSFKFQKKKSTGFERKTSKKITTRITTFFIEWWNFLSIKIFLLVPTIWI